MAVNLQSSWTYLAAEQLQIDGVKMQQDFPRLEFMCASKIMAGGETAARFLPYAPPSLIPSLFRALLTNAYQNGVGSAGLLSPLTISELLLWWPSSTFSLMSHAPLPTSNSRGLQYFNIPQEKMVTFINAVFYDILYVYLNKLRVQEWREKCGVSRLDLSGTLDLSGVLTGHPHTEVTHLLLDHVKYHYHPNAPPDYDKREIVVDLNIIEEVHVRDLCVLAELSQHHGAGLRVKLGQVAITSLSSSLTTVLQTLRHTDVHCVVLKMCNAVDINNLLHLSKPLCGLNLHYTYVSDVQSLTKFSHLSHLSVTGVRLTGKCGVLADLRVGLKYLCFSACTLKAPDLNALTGSHHTSSLIQLDLTDENFGRDDEMTALCCLCRHLQKVNVLDFGFCGLQQSSPLLMKELVAAFASMPCLMQLQLTRNDILSLTLMQEFPSLATSPTLHLLRLTVPSDAYLSDDYSVNEARINTLKRSLDQSLRSIRCPPPIVAWEEESLFSHWYYAV